MYYFEDEAINNSLYYLLFHNNVICQYRVSFIIVSSLVVCLFSLCERWAKHPTRHLLEFKCFMNRSPANDLQAWRDN